MKAMVKPCRQSLEQPEKTQEEVLRHLVAISSQTEYGNDHGSGNDPHGFENAGISREGGGQLCSRL